MKKNKNIMEKEQKKLEFPFLSTVKIDLGYMIAEANKIFFINEKQALELKQTIFFKKWSIREM